MSSISRPVELEKINIASTLLVILLILLALLFFGGQALYGLIDQKTFPDRQTEYAQNLSEEEKGIQLLQATMRQFRYEMDSTFGWSANDILFNYYLFDNRAYRQFGVYNATRVLLDVYSRVIAKLGNNDREDENLYKAKMTYFAISPSRWALISESAESAYQKGFKELDTYMANLTAGKARYNCKTDDIHTALTTITGDQILGYALGLLENNEDLPFYTLDNRIYEAQGIALVVRDFLCCVYALYPSVAQKNNKDNFAEALKYLDMICTYDPMWISSTPFNTGAVVRSWLLNVKNRIEDISNSLRI